MQILKWGDGLAALLPESLVDELDLKEGDDLEIVAVRKGKIEIEAKEQRPKRALEQLAALNWTLPPDYKFDRNEANDR